MKKTVAVLTALAAAFAAEALVVTIDLPSPAAEKDFAAHVGRMGASANVSLAVAAHPYAVESKADEAFRLRIDGGKAWVSGRSAEAVSHGLYELLERMGCDWVMPGPAGEVVPECADPRPADCDVEQAPSFRVRCPWMPGSPGKLADVRVAYDLWKTRKKLHPDKCRWTGHPLVMRGGHVWDVIVRENKAAFEANPDMYALVRQPDGSFVRKGPQVETTDPRVLDLFEKYIRREFSKHKWPKDKAVCLSVGPADGGGFSQSRETQAVASGRRIPLSGAVDGTDVLILLCNTLLRRMEGEFPNLHLGFYLYSWHSEFPVRYKPDPKVVIVIADISYSRLHSTLEPVPTRRYYRSIMEKWRETPNVKFFRGYNWNLAENFLPYSKIGMWADDLPMYRDMNVQGVYNESCTSWSTLGPSNYVEAELLWNVDADPWAVLSKYCRAAFGEGGPFLEEYYRALTKRQSEAKVEAGSFHGFHIIYDRRFTAKGLGLFDRAAAAAKRPEERERIARMRFPLEQLDEFLRFRELQFAFRFGEAKEVFDGMIAKRAAAAAEGGGWVTASSASMLKRFLADSVEASAKYSSAPYSIVRKLPDAMPSAIDPWDGGEAMGYADPAIDDANWFSTKTYSTPWSLQGLSGGTPLWYRTRLGKLPKGPTGLLVGGSAAPVRVYLNGKFVGEGRGFAKPLAFDLTDFAEPEGENLLAVQIKRGGGEIGVGGIIYPSFVFTGPRLAERAPKTDTSTILLPGGAVRKAR